MSLHGVTALPLLLVIPVILMLMARRCERVIRVHADGHQES
jgi:hypothetical protein